MNPVPIILTARRESILRLLVRYKGLTTKQIWQALAADRDRAVIAHDLKALAAHKLVRSEQLQPWRGATGDYVWTLLRAGAAAVDAPFGNQYYRRSRPEQLQHRGALLELETVIRSAGYALITPVSYNPQHPLPKRTPQSELLEQRAYQYAGWLLDSGQLSDADWWSLSARVNNRQLTSGWPRQTNDWLAYHPDRPRTTVVFIPQPPEATLQFWVRDHDYGRTRPGRIKLYKPLLGWFRVCAVFADDSTRRELEPQLRAGRIAALLVSEVGPLLQRDFTGAAQQ